MAKDTPCPYCESTDRELSTGELGYGTEVYCDNCGFRLGNIDPRDWYYKDND